MRIDWIIQIGVLVGMGVFIYYAGTITKIQANGINYIPVEYRETYQCNGEKI